MSGRAAAGAGAGGAHPSERFLRAFSAGLAECRKQGNAYGLCVKAHLPDIQKGACEAEFRAMEQCFTASMRRQLAKSRK
eukprot:jgi/Tetstr1/442298/TSEL_030439.t1